MSTHESTKSVEPLRLSDAASWSIGGHVFVQLIRFSSHLFLTRIFSPEIFGLFAVIWALISASTMLCDIGLNQTIVRSSDVSRRFLNTIWTMQVLLGFAVALLVIGLGTGAWYLANRGLWIKPDVYGHPHFFPLVLASAILPILSALESLGLPLSVRNLGQRQVVLIEGSSQLIGTMCTVAVACAFRSPWAILAGALTTAVCRIVGSYLISNLRFSFELDKGICKQALRFGSWVLLGSVLGIAATNADRLVLGALFTPLDLGNYAVALILVSAAREVFAKLAGSVYFPLFSRVVNSASSELSNTYYRGRKYFDILSTVAFCVFYFFSSDIVRLLYEARYQGVSNVLNLLGISMLGLRFLLSEYALYALGKSNYCTAFIAAQALFAISGIVLGSQIYGFTGAVLFIGISQVAAFPIVVLAMRKVGLFDFKRELNGLILSALIVFAFWGGHAIVAKFFY